MYSDPSNIRQHVVKVRFNEREAALVDALVNYTGQQRAALVRELILEQAQLVLSGHGDYGLLDVSNEGPQLALKLA